MIVFVGTDFLKTFAKDEMIDNLTCSSHEMISDLFNQLCSMKDNLISAIPMESPS